MQICKKCGSELSAKSKFCEECGSPVEDNKSKREVTYDGIIHKCPNCGEVLKSFKAFCPACGYELRDVKSSNAVEELSRKLEEIELSRETIGSGGGLFGMLNVGRPVTKTDEQKISLIRSFPIPNTKEDLYEFLILSKSNIEVRAYENTSNIQNARLEVSDAWKAKFEQAYHKAKLLFKDDDRINEIDKMYNDTMKAIKNAKLFIWKVTGIIFGSIFLVTIIMLLLAKFLGGFDDKEQNSNSNNDGINFIESEEKNYGYI